MSLVNASVVIGNVIAKPNTTITGADFNITSADITIYNTTYGVYLLNKTVSAKIEDRGIVNSTTGILLDFTPIVTQLYIDNSTAFAMLPSLRVATVAKGQFATGNGGARQQGPNPPEGTPRDVFPNVDENVTIANATLSASAGDFNLTLTLRNSGSTGVKVLGVTIFCNQTPEFYNFTDRRIGAVLPEGTGAFGSGPSPPPQGPDERGQLGAEGPNVTGGSPYSQENSSLRINISRLYAIWAMHGNSSFNISLQNPATGVYVYGFNSMFTPMGKSAMDDMFLMTRPADLNLMVADNGTLYMPSADMLSATPERASDSGYLLSAGGSGRFSYNNTSRLGNSPWLIRLKDNATYRVVVLTDRGVVEKNVTVASAVK
jgi:hypothetical protein